MKTLFKIGIPKFALARAVYTRTSPPQKRAHFQPISAVSDAKARNQSSLLRGLMYGSASLRDS